MTNNTSISLDEGAACGIPYDDVNACVTELDRGKNTEAEVR